MVLVRLGSRVHLLSSIQGERAVVGGAHGTLVQITSRQSSPTAPPLPHIRTPLHGRQAWGCRPLPGNGPATSVSCRHTNAQKNPGYIFRHGTPSPGDEFSRRGRGGRWAFSFFPGAGHGRICRTMFYTEARPDDFCTMEGRINMCPPGPHTLRMLRVPKARHGRLRAKCMSVGG